MTKEESTKIFHVHLNEIFEIKVDNEIAVIVDPEKRQFEVAKMIYLLYGFTFAQMLVVNTLNHPQCVHVQN